MFEIIKQYLKSKTVVLVGLPLALLSAANVYFEHNLTATEYSAIGWVFSSLIVWARAKTTIPLSEK